jgi:hypothetical protein
VDVQKIRRDLRARYVLEGSVRKAAERSEDPHTLKTLERRQKSAAILLVLTFPR